MQNNKPSIGGRMDILWNYTMEKQVTLIEDKITVKIETGETPFSLSGGMSISVANVLGSYEVYPSL